MSTPAERWARRIASQEPAGDTDWTEVARARWDAVAPDWDARLGRDWDAGWRADVVPFLRGLLPAAAPVSILDAGCGAGHLVEILARDGCQAAGIDLSPAMIGAAQARLAQAGLAADLRVADLAATGFPDAAFDAVACITSLEWVPDPAAALAEFARLLRPRGVLLVGILSALSPIRSSAYKRFLNVQVAQNSLLPWELTALLTDLGWRVAAQGPAGWLVGFEAARGAAEADPRLAQCVCGIWLVGAQRPETSS